MPAADVSRTGSIKARPRRGAAALFLLLSLAGAACSRSYRFSVEPEDALVFVNGKPAESGRDYSTREPAINVLAKREGHEDYQAALPLDGILAPQSIAIRLEKKNYLVEVKVVQGRAACRIDDRITGETPLQTNLPYGEHNLRLKKDDGIELEAVLNVRREETFLFRLQPRALPVRALGIYPCGRQPKQVIFSPDNRFLYLPLLDGEGFQVFDLNAGRMFPVVKVGPKFKLKAFPEGLFIEKYRAFFVSQMGTNNIFEYRYEDDGSVVFRRALHSGGVFPKFIAYAPSLDLVAVSNWISSDVALIAYASGKVMKKIPGLTTPRGIAFSPDGSALYIASYDGGNLLRYDTASWTEAGRFSRPGGAMRHIVLDGERRRLFVSDMARGVVFELETDGLTLIHTYKADHNTNTIDLDPSGRYLFASNRGPNNKINYTLRSPEDGKVLVFDTQERRLVASILGGNQPTGLDVSSDGRYLVFTNFLDENFEIYDITPLTRAGK